MPADRYYFPKNLEGTVVLEGEEARHLIKVMRGRAGESVELVNGMGQLAEGTITELTRREVQININSTSEGAKEREIHLYQALPRINRLDTIIEKGTELGVTTFFLFPGALSDKKELSRQQQERLQRIAIAAMKQCGRLYLPKIVLLPPLKAIDSFPPGAYFGDTSSEAPPLRDLVDRSAPFAIFIGPESGFSSDEESLLCSHHVTGVRLHPNILRTDTAPLVALSLCS